MVVAYCWQNPTLVRSRQSETVSLLGQTPRMLT